MEGPGDELAAGTIRKADLLAKKERQARRQIIQFISNAVGQFWICDRSLFFVCARSARGQRKPNIAGGDGAKRQAAIFERNQVQLCLPFEVLLLERRQDAEDNWDFGCSLHVAIL